MNEKILQLIRERGLLIERDVYKVLDMLENADVAGEMLESLEKISGQKFITRGVLNKNFGFVKQTLAKLPGEAQLVLEKTFVNLGISLEVSSERKVIGEEGKKELRRNTQKFRVFYAETKPDKKIEVGDFTGYFRARFQQIQKILMGRPELQNNLVSIGKIAGERANFSFIGVVREKRVTKNKNLIITFEDLTGKINALVKFERQEIFEKAEELQLDDVVGVKASGNNEMVFIYDIFYPDAFIYEKTRFEEDVNVAFLSDVHAGSDRHLRRSMDNFLKWLNSEDETARKIKYIFFVGDNVDGVGIFPTQEEFLELKTMKEQYELLASYLKRIPREIMIFMCPGQHDAVRVAEPQPIIGRRYASALYEIENLVLVTNPAMVKLLEGDKEFKILMYHGGSIHAFINEVKELRELKAHKCPAKAIKHMLKRRHLAPSHGVSPQMIYIPNVENDPLVISEVPDVLCTGEVHRLDVENYHGTLMITGSCWQAQTAFEESIGNEVDPAKVAVLNLKTREFKILDFGVREEIERDYSVARIPRESGEDAEEEEIIEEADGGAE